MYTEEGDTGYSRGYVTLGDIVDQEVAGALDGVDPGFDLDGFVDALKERQLIVFDEDVQVFRIVNDDENGNPAFWALVEEFDARAMTAPAAGPAGQQG